MPVSIFVLIVVKGNAELSKINIARAKVRLAQLDLGEKLGLVSTYNNTRFFISERTELAKKYRGEKKRNKMTEKIEVKEN